MKPYSKVEERDPRLRLTETEQRPGDQRTVVIFEPCPINRHEHRCEEKRQKAEQHEALLIPSKVPPTWQIESHISDSDHNHCRSTPEQCVGSRRRVHHHD